MDENMLNDSNYWADRWIPEWRDTALSNTGEVAVFTWSNGKYDDECFNGLMADIQPIKQLLTPIFNLSIDSIISFSQLIYFSSIGRKIRKYSFNDLFNIKIRSRSLAII